MQGHALHPKLSGLSEPPHLHNRALIHALDIRRNLEVAISSGEAGDVSRSLEGRHGIITFEADRIELVPARR
jgi:hypothetical protein